jgi:hypothetical protein
MVKASLMGIWVGAMGVGGVYPIVVGVGVVGSLLPVVEFGFIQCEPNTSIREGKFKIPLLEELNISNEHRRYFVIAFHLFTFVIDC